jgi:hypothetical protein
VDAAQKPVAWTEYHVPQTYPDNITRTVGLIALRYGQIDRLIGKAIKAKTGSTLEESIALFREGGVTLGKWIQLIKGRIKAGQLVLPEKWLEQLEGHLNALNATRNGILHDALLMDKHGNYVWMSGTSPDKRGHRPFHPSQLSTALEQLDAFREFIMCAD